MTDDDDSVSHSPVSFKLEDAGCPIEFSSETFSTPSPMMTSASHRSLNRRRRRSESGASATDAHDGGGASTSTDVHNSSDAGLPSPLRHQPRHDVCGPSGDADEDETMLHVSVGGFPTEANFGESISSFSTSSNFGSVGGLGALNTPCCEQVIRWEEAPVLY